MTLFYWSSLSYIFLFEKAFKFLMSFSKLCTTCDSNDSDTLCLKKTVIKNSLILPVQRQANHRHLDEEFYPFITKKVKIFEQLMTFFDVWKIFKSRWTRFVHLYHTPTVCRKNSRCCFDYFFGRQSECDVIYESGPSWFTTTDLYRLSELHLTTGIVVFWQNILADWGQTIKLQFTLDFTDFKNLSYSIQCILYRSVTVT